MSSSKMKKMIVATAAASAVLCTSAMAATVTTSDVYLRSGAGMSYSKLMVVSEGTSVKVVSKTGSWTKVKVGSKTGYIGSGYLTSGEATKKTNSSTQKTSSTKKTVYVSVSSLNVRSGASTSNSVIGSLGYGSKASVVGTAGDWYKIKYGGGYGYIKSSFTTTQKLSSDNSENDSDTKTETTETTTNKTMYSSAAVNVRSSASMSGRVLGSLSVGQKVTVKGTSGSWKKISFNGKTGYVYGKYLTSTKPSSSDDDGYTSQETYDSDNSSSNSSISSYAKNFLGCRYIYGGTSPSGFDCSGFTRYVYSHCGISLPRTSSAQYASAKKVSRSNLRSGDLVFFGSGGVSHVGIYIGNGQIVHAANSKRGVCIDSLSNSWYSSHYIGGGRY